MHAFMIHLLNVAHHITDSAQPLKLNPRNDICRYLSSALSPFKYSPNACLLKYFTVEKCNLYFFYSIVFYYSISERKMPTAHPDNF